MSRPLLIRGGTRRRPGRRPRTAAPTCSSKDGVVAEVADRIEAGDAEVFDASRLLVFPGFIDLHAHLREPGREYAETIRTGLAAAAAGGFTAVVRDAEHRARSTTAARSASSSARRARRGRRAAAIRSRRSRRGRRARR